jgi:hypothetical protein
MKSFYEMLRILENVNESYGRGHVFGEDEDDPYSAEVNILDPDWYNVAHYWEVEGSFYVRNRLQDGSEPPISKPEFQVAGKTKDRWGNIDKYTGTEFMNPGKNLENLPEPLGSHARDWLDKEVDRYLGNYNPDDSRDDGDNYNPDPDGHGYWDRYWSTGPGRDH